MYEVLGLTWTQAFVLRRVFINCGILPKVEESHDQGYSYSEVFEVGGIYMDFEYWERGEEIGFAIVDYHDYGKGSFFRWRKGEVVKKDEFDPNYLERLYKDWRDYMKEIGAFEKF